ncbi:MAG: DUF5723 family protein [Chitinophagaceae bacterium]
MKTIFLTLLLLVSIHTTYAQFDFVAYQLRGSLTQSTELNPSFINNHKVNVNFIIPFFGLHLNANQPFSLKTLLSKKGSQYTLNLSQYLNNTLMRTALISTQVDIPILLVAFDTKIGNFSLGSSIKANVNFGINNDFLRLVWQGNVGNKQLANIQLKNTGIYTNVYLDNFIGFSKSILEEKLRIGGRFHFLVSPGGAQTKIENASISTDQNTYDIRLQLNNASLYMNAFNAFDLNYGGAVDLGAEYKLNNQWSFQLSINNIGAIYFNKDIQKHTLGNLDTTLQGLDLDNLINGGTDFKFPNIDITTTEGEIFMQWLPLKMYLGATWQFTKKQRLDATFSLYNIPAIRSTIPAIMIGYNAQLGRILNWAFNVSYNTYTSVALGTGFTFNAGPIQLYVMLDNFLPAFDLSLIRSIDTRIGLNLNCGYRYKKRKNKTIESKTSSKEKATTESKELDKLPEIKQGKDSIGLINLENTNPINKPLNS